MVDTAFGASCIDIRPPPRLSFLASTRTSANCSWPRCVALAEVVFEVLEGFAGGVAGSAAYAESVTRGAATASRFPISFLIIDSLEVIQVDHCLGRIFLVCVTFVSIIFQNLLRF